MISVVDALLKKYALHWVLDPYRIVNDENEVIYKGKSFNLTDEGIKKMLLNHRNRGLSMFGRVPIPRKY